MISKKAMIYEDKQWEKYIEFRYMDEHHKCPHCLGDIEDAGGSLRCLKCGLTRTR